MTSFDSSLSSSLETDCSDVEIQQDWYALHVFRNKVSACRDRVSEFNCGGARLEYYAPFVRIDKINQHGKRVVTEKPLISSLFFIHCTRQQVDSFDRSMGTLTRIYTHLKDGIIQPIAIPLHQMEMFIQVSSGDQEGLEYYGPDAFDWRKGEKVRVIDGRFKGLEGEIKRIDGSKRLIVAIEGICCVATSYIPRCFLEKIE